MKHPEGDVEPTSTDATDAETGTEYSQTEQTAFEGDSPEDSNDFVQNEAAETDPQRDESSEWSENSTEIAQDRSEGEAESTENGDSDGTDDGTDGGTDEPSDSESRDENSEENVANDGSEGTSNNDLPVNTSDDESVDGDSTQDDQADSADDEPSAPTVDATPEPEPVAAAPEASASPAYDDTPLARELAEITRRRQALKSQTLPLPPEPRIFTVANQKGGVGKTTTTVNLAAGLARGGARVLVIDLDPQGNASTALGVEHRADTISVYDVIINDEPMSEVVQKSPELGNLYCVPATIHLAGAEIELVSLVAREQRLRTSLDKFLSESEEKFHYVFIDCPPSLGLLTINAFVAAREVLIPIQCEYYALEGLSQLLSNIQLIERHLNPSLEVSTILLTMYDGRTNLANQVADDVREHFPKEVLNTLIPRSVRISEAPSYGQSVISYDPSSPGSLSYLEAAAEIAKRGAPA